MLVGDETFYFTAAIGLLESGELALDPLWPPLYAHFLAGICSLSASPMAALAIVQTALLALAAICVRTLVRRLFAAPAAADVAAVAMLGYPPLAGFAFYAWPEILNLTLFVAALALLVVGRDRAAWSAAAGAALGVTLLTKLLLWPFVVLLAAPALRLRTRASLGSATALLVTCGLVVALLAPVLRPEGEPASWQANIGFNLLVGLRDTSRRSFVDSIVAYEYLAYRESASNPTARAAILRRHISDHVRVNGPWAVLASQLGKQYHRLLDHESFFTAQLPGGTLAASPVGYQGVPHALGFALRAWSSLCYAALLVAAVFGAFAVRTDSQDPWTRDWLRLLAVFVVYNLSIFLALHVVSRYRVQLLPVLVLAGARGAAWAGDQRSAGRRPLEALAQWSRWRKAATLLSVTAVLSLAFAAAVVGV